MKGSSESRFSGMVSVPLLCALVVQCQGPSPHSNHLSAAGLGLTCGQDALSQAAFVKAGAVDSDSAVLPNGRLLTPVGDRVSLGVFPLGLVVNHAETRAYVSHNGDKEKALMVIDLESMKVLQTVKLRRPYRAIALSPDESELFVGGGNSGMLLFFSILDDGTVQKEEETYLGGYLTDIESSPDGSLVYALASTNSHIYVVDREGRQVTATYKADTIPYDLLVSQDDARLYVSHLGSSNVLVLDALTGDVLGDIKVGKNPEGLALDPQRHRLYVANSDSDTLSVIDTQSLEVASEVDLTHSPLFYRHGNLNEVALTPDGQYLLVTEASFNRVDVLDADTLETVGQVPTGWYPTAMAVGKSALYVLSSKGFGAIEGSPLKIYPGFLQRIQWWDTKQLEEWTKQVEKNNSLAEHFFQGCSPEQIPALSGKDSPIKHVVLVVRENKTYDMVLGDLEFGDGDPNLTVFGEQYTPNLHKLAREFVNMDNFYNNADVSVVGHMWTTSAQCNDFVEKVWYDQQALYGYEPATLPEAPTIFEHLLQHHVSFRNYGEFPSFGPGMFDQFKPYFDNKYPFWTMEVKDVDKVAEIIREMNLGIFPSFIYVVLPNDHTYGTRPGKPSPESLVADNDRATGMLVEAISHSEYWPETAIFIIEDDPQGVGDHVEAHRSLCIVVSPWVKRGYLSSVHYDVPSLYRTIELILGVPPMGKNDALAPPMLDIWSNEPELTPYEAVPVDVPWRMNPKNLALSDMAERCDFTGPDRCEGLGKMLWVYMKGNVQPPPYAKGIDR